MFQAILHTERVHLIPLSDEHLDHQVELDADPEVLRYMGGVRRREQVETEHREFLAEADQVAGLGYWAGFTEGHFVGYWILRHRNPTTRNGSKGRPNSAIGFCAADPPPTRDLINVWAPLVPAQCTENPPSTKIACPVT
ncbi:GNAT family N-acetyltransferase [Streptomyces sp. NPDC006195]|uniref:GNAT family N-acetyltransferase n=1 Tax=unclassified Streptomyces TaxID=2593676 RepID=UPI0033A4A757